MTVLPQHSGDASARIRDSRDLEGEFEIVDNEMRTPAAHEELLDGAQELTLAAANQFAHEGNQLLAAADSTGGK